MVVDLGVIGKGREERMAPTDMAPQFFPLKGKEQVQGGFTQVTKVSRSCTANGSEHCQSLPGMLWEAAGLDPGRWLRAEGESNQEGEGHAMKSPRKGKTKRRPGDHVWGIFCGHLGGRVGTTEKEVGLRGGS